MIAFAEGFGRPQRPSRGGFSPSMAGSENEDVMDFAKYLEANAPLGIDGREAFRMANAQHVDKQAATFRMAIQIAMGELAREAMRRLEQRQAEDAMAA